MNTSSGKRTTGFILKSTMLLSLLALLASCSEKFEQPELGYRSVSIIEKRGYQFKDLNKNGELDAYEDWINVKNIRLSNVREATKSPGVKAAWANNVQELCEASELGNPYWFTANTMFNGVADLPHDSENSLFPYGFGLSYDGE